MALSTENVTKLKGLIDQAESNGEQPDFIQNTLIPQFKAKYDAPAAPAKPAEQPYNPHGAGGFAPVAKTASDVSQRIAGEFSGLAPAKAGERVMGYPEYAARLGTAVASSAADLVQAPINWAANLPSDQNAANPNETLGEMVGRGARKVYGAYEKTPMYHALADAGNAFANTGAGKALYAASQSPAAQALAQPAGQVLNAATTFGVPGVGKAAEAGAEAAAGAVKRGAEKVVEGATGVPGEATIKASEDALKQSVKTGIEKGIRPTSTDKGAFSKRQDFQAKAEQAVSTIAQNKDEIKVVDEAGEVTGTHPRTAAEAAQAIDQAKKLIYKKYHAMSVSSGEKDAGFSIQPVVDKLDKITGNKAKNIQPNLGMSRPIRQYAESMKREISDLNAATPEQVESRIEELNASLKGFYANPDRVSAAKARVDASVAQALREQLDRKITEATDPGYQDLKNQYGALKHIEMDVNHRANVVARAASKNVMDMTDIFTGAELIGGLITGNPLAVAKGVAGRVTKEVYKRLNRSDRFVNKMFEDAYRHEDLKRAATKGGPNAGALRGDEKEVQKAGLESVGGEEQGGQNIQRKQKAGGAGPAPRQAQDVQPAGKLNKRQQAYLKALGVDGEPTEATAKVATEAKAKPKTAGEQVADYASKNDLSKGTFNSHLTKFLKAAQAAAATAGTVAINRSEAYKALKAAKEKKQKGDNE